MKKFRFLFLLTLLLADRAVAEEAYIVDQLLVGLHQEKDMDSPIIKVLGTGTQVEIISREGDFAQIREKEEGKIGWVDASYLMLEKPAKLQLAELQMKMKELQNQQNVQATQSLQQEHEKKVKELNQKIENLQQQLSSEKLNAAELEAKISQLEKKLAQMEAAGTDDRITELEKQNAELQNQLDSIRESQTNTTAENAKIPPILTLFSFIKERPVQILLGILALAAFLFGRFWEDRRVRKRHGGFRV